MNVIIEMCKVLNFTNVAEIINEALLRSLIVGPYLLLISVVVLIFKLIKHGFNI